MFFHPLVPVLTWQDKDHKVNKVCQIPMHLVLPVSWQKYDNSMYKLVGYNQIPPRLVETPTWDMNIYFEYYCLQCNVDQVKMGIQHNIRVSRLVEWCKVRPVSLTLQYFTIPCIIHMDSTGFHWTPLDSTGLHWTSLYNWDFTTYWYKTGLHWTPLDFTGLHYIIETSLHTGTKLDSTGLHWTASCILHNTGLDWTGLDSTATLNTNLDSTGLHCCTQHKPGLHWTVSCILHKTGLDWTPLPYSTQNWTPLDCQLLLTQNWTPLNWTGLHCCTQHKTGLHWTASYI